VIPGEAKLYGTIAPFRRGPRADPRADARDLRRHRQRLQVEIVVDIRDGSACW
jgi:hypothetical protein